MSEQILAELRAFKARGLKQVTTINRVITLIQDQHATILRQRKQLADLQRKQTHV